MTESAAASGAEAPLDTRPTASEPKTSGTHSRLLDAAAALFREKGYGGTTTRDIAARVGIRNASIYHHVRRKDDLLYTLCADSLTRITDAVSKAIATEEEPIARLRALITAHLETSLADQDKHATMLMELRSLPNDRRREIIALRDRHEALVRSVIEEAHVAGALRPNVTVRHSALALLNMLNWTIFWYRPDGELTASELATNFTSIFLGGVLG